MTSPRVSVIVPVYNCRSTVERALRSAFDQSMAPELIEVIAVDDGSADGGAELLDRLAERESRLVVIHQPNSGGPGAPRNVGIDRAAGEFVFFLDADDHLAPEALERMCAMADRNGTDVVVGKYVGIDREVPRWMFRRNVHRTTVLDRDPGVYGTLSPLKLFRRKLLDRAGIRFVEGVLSHEDQLFTARAYFNADGISVLGDHDCYYWVERADGTSILQRGGAPADQFYPCIDEVMRYTAGCVGPGEQRDLLLHRHFRTDVLPRFGRRFLELPAAARRAERDGAHVLVESWFTPGVTELSGARERVIAHCLRHDLDEALDDVVRTEVPELVVDGGRLYAAYPHFRDPAAGIPDACFDVTDRPPVERALARAEWADGRLAIRGHVLLRGLAGEQDRRLVLRKQGRGREEHRIPLRGVATPELTERHADGHDYGSAGLAAEIDLAAAAAGRPLPKGLWDLYVAVSVAGHEILTRLGGPAAGVTAPGLRMAAVAGGAAPYARSYFTEWYENLTLVVGEWPKDPGPVLLLDEVGWAGRGRLRVRGHIPAALTDRTPVEFTPRLRRRGDGTILDGDPAVEIRGDRLVLTAEFDLTRCDATRFDASYELVVGESTMRERMTLPEGLPLPPGPRSCARLAVRRAEPYRTAKGELAIRVTERKAVQRLRRLFRRTAGG